MRSVARYLMIPVIVIAAVGCQQKAAVVADPEAYLKEMEQWKEGRLERLKSKTG